MNYNILMWVCIISGAFLGVLGAFFQDVISVVIGSTLLLIATMVIVLKRLEHILNSGGKK